MAVTVYLHGQLSLSFFQCSTETLRLINAVHEGGQSKFHPVRRNIEANRSMPWEKHVVTGSSGVTL